jgi:hypothetical protein
MSGKISSWVLLKIKQLGNGWPGNWGQIGAVPMISSDNKGLRCQGGNRDWETISVEVAQPYEAQLGTKEC